MSLTGFTLERMASRGPKSNLQIFLHPRKDFDELSLPLIQTIIHRKVMIRLNKLHAATRQLEGAIVLLLSGGDPVCVTTLAHAAALILHDLVRHRAAERSASPIFMEALKGTPLGEKIHDEKSYRKLLRDGPNWLKHANDDPDSEYDFHADMPPVLMTIAIADSIALDAMTPLQEMFMAWMMATHNTHEKNIELAKLAQEWFPFDVETTFEQRLAAGYARVLVISSSHKSEDC